MNIEEKPILVKVSPEDKVAMIEWLIEHDSEYPGDYSYRGHTVPSLAALKDLVIRNWRADRSQTLWTFQFRDQKTAMLFKLSWG
jgi:3,4-dihydroxy-2-butanone 4-phosphate synthase